MTDGEVRVFHAVTDGAEEAAIARALLGLLDAGERERHDLLVREADRRQYRAAHALTRCALSHAQPGVPASAWRFAATDHGRPEIASPPSALRFNLSHTDGLVACAVTVGRAVGLDVEDAGRPLDIFELAPEVFAPPELAALRRAGEPEARHLFFELWTLKEAYLKARGLGLSLPLQQFWFDVGVSPLRFGTAWLAADDACWQFHQARPTPRHHLALAVHGEGVALSVTVRSVSLVQLAVELAQD